MSKNIADQISLRSIEEFRKEIEETVTKNNLNYLEAVSSYCAQKGISEDDVVKLISPALQHKIEEEAVRLRLLKRKHRTNANNIFDN